MFKRTHWWAIFIGVFVVMILALGTATVVYGIHRYQWEGPGMRMMASVLHVSAAQVGDKKIAYGEYLHHLDAERKYLSGPAAKAQGMPSELTPELRKEALDRAIRIAAVEEFAQKRGVIVTPLDVDRVYDGLIAQAGTSTSPGEIQSFLRDQFGWNEAEFKNYVVRPALMEDVLKQKEFLATKKADAFDNELNERLKQPDIKIYMAF